MKPVPDNFLVKIELPVQWGEQDAFGHVNNIHFLRWFESARIEYLKRCGARISNAGTGPILAAVHCDYRRQLTFPDTVIVSASVSNIGNKSIVLDHYLWSKKSGDLSAEGQSTVVMFDYQNQKTVPVTAEIRAKINSIEAGQDHD